MGCGNSTDKKLREIIMKQFYSTKALLDNISEIDIAKITVFTVINRDKN